MRTHLSEAVLERDLSRLDGVWAAGLRETYDAYIDSAGESQLALAAALVEFGVRLQGLGVRAARPESLLLGDLCLARASRILADSGDRRLQVGFSRAVEKVSAEAAGEDGMTSIRELLFSVLGARR